MAKKIIGVICLLGGSFLLGNLIQEVKIRKLKKDLENANKQKEECQKQVTELQEIIDKAEEEADKLLKMTDIFI